MILTDTHTHLYADEFDPDRDELISRAIESGITRFFLPNIDSSSVPGLLELSEKYPNHCFPMMGLHPCSVKENWKDELSKIENELSKKKYCAVGEIGIDLYWDKSFVEEQETVFKRQVEIANRQKCSIVIHSRDSFDMICDLLDECPKEEPCGIFHCFTGNAQQAQRAIDLGFYLGIGGVLSFKNSGLDKVVETIDIRKVVLETDAPYLAPTPHRGKRNLPEYLIQIAQKLSEIKGISLEEVAEITTANSKKIFLQ